MTYNDLLTFYKGKKILITGNTGFKGAWLTYILLSAGAIVTGYALNPPTTPNLFSIADLENKIKQYYADIRDLNTLTKVLQEAKPEFVFHLAAQPIVRESYKDPITTYSTNIMGTVNICEAIRKTNESISFLNVTTDKVYRNNEWEWGYRETDYLDGFDPYSNSKSCSELITRSYRDSFFNDGRVKVSTARAGNVIGGGDFSIDRIIPDCVRAVTESDGIIKVRSPNSIRPYQHMLEPLFAYLLIAKAQYEDIKYAGNYNVGPDDEDCVSTGTLVDIFCKKWNRHPHSKTASWINILEEKAPHEATFLKLDCSKLKHVMSWKPRWDIEKAVEETITWTEKWFKKENILNEMNKEIENFCIPLMERKNYC